MQKSRASQQIGDSIEEVQCVSATSQIAEITPEMNRSRAVRDARYQTLFPTPKNHKDTAN